MNVSSIGPASCYFSTAGRLAASPVYASIILYRTVRTPLNETEKNRIIQPFYVALLSGSFERWLDESFFFTSNLTFLFARLGHVE